METMNRLNNNLRRLQETGKMINGAQKYLNGLARAQSKPFIQRGMGNFGFSMEVAGYDLADTDTYTDAWDGASDAVDSAWEWLEDGIDYLGDGVTDVWDRLGEQISLMKDGFTSMLDIAYVTADGVAELWAVFKWVGGPSEMLELKRKRDSWLIRKKQNTLKYGPFYIRSNEDGSRPIEMPTDAENEVLITEEQAKRLPEDHPDFLGTHTIIGLPQATWKYYLAGFDGITPDWRNPLHYPNAVLYWYYDAQIEKIEAISSDFDKSALGRSRDWLFERGTLLKAWMAGGWEELFNMKQLIDQNYRVAKAKTELLGHDALAEVQGAALMTSDGDLEQTDTIEVLGIKSSKQVAMEKIKKLRKMFPYNAKAFMGPQMWFTMHDFRQKKKNKASTPYPLIMLEDKISENEMGSLMKYLEKTRDEKLAEAVEALNNGIPGAFDERTGVMAEYDESIGAINNMPMIFIEGMMSAFGGRAGPFYSLDADMQFGDYVWANSDAFSVNEKPEKPSGIRPFWRDVARGSALGSEIENGWLTGPIGNTLINRESWANAQPAFSVRGWGYGTQIFTPAQTQEEGNPFGYANLGHFFDWHPFNALWCHDGETHMAGQYSFLHNSLSNSQDTADYGVLQSDLDGAYMSDYWAWNESLRFKPLFLLQNAARKEGGEFETTTYSSGTYSTSTDNIRHQINLGKVDFLVRRNKAITDFANSGIALNQAINGLIPIANMRMTSDASFISKNEVASQAQNNQMLEGNTSAAAVDMATGVFGASSPKSSGLYSLNYSPVQSIFAVGYSSSNVVKSIWSATTGKSLKYGPAIGHGRKVRYSRRRNRNTSGGTRFVAGITNYHTVTTIGYNPYAVTVDRNYRSRAGIDGSYAMKPYLFNIAERGAGEQFNWIMANLGREQVWVDTGHQKWLNTAPSQGFSSPNHDIQSRINWFTLSTSSQDNSGFSRSPTMISPGFFASTSLSHLETGTFLIAGLTPPVETVSQTGLTPRPGLYSSNVQSGITWPMRGAPKPGFGRFPGSNANNFVAVNEYQGSPRTQGRAAYDYVDPLFSSVITMSKEEIAGTGINADEWTTHLHANAIRKGLRLGSIMTFSGVSASELDHTGEYNNLLYATMMPSSPSTSFTEGVYSADYEGYSKMKDNNNFQGLSDFLATEPYGTENMTASANFNYARMGNADASKLALALANSWSRKPQGHSVLSFVIAEIIAGRKVKPIENPIGEESSNTFSFESTTSPPIKLEDIPGSNLLNMPKPWTVNQIKNALLQQWAVGSNQKLIESIVLAEPDSNPMGVWFETTQSDHEFFGITDMEKLKENAELILDDEQIKLMSESEMWNFHRALANKDKNALSPDVVDWFNSKVTKYGWCHIMQGAMPVRLDKMKQPTKMPRYWAPLFVPFRPIAEFAPRVFFGTSLEGKKLFSNADNRASTADETIEYRRKELIGVAPYAAENDDIRLHDSVRLVADAVGNTNWNEAMSSLDGVGEHWASQYSWLNCGWFGFDSVAEAQMFMKLQFDTTTVSFDDASYNWKGMLNGPPTGATGFGPIDDLIDFVRYFDSMIMSKIDVERAYLSALRRYESMKIRFDKMAQFKIDLVDASLQDLTSGLAKVVQTGNMKPKSYRWLPVFAYASNGLAKLHPENAEAIFVMLESSPNAELTEITETNWEAADASPSKFVAGCIIEQQIDNDLSEGADWDFLTYVSTQGRSDGKNTLDSALTASGFPGAPAEALLPWIVGGKAVRKKVDVVGGVFKDWETMLTADSSPLGRFLNKMRAYNMNIDMLWNSRLPGFSMSMRDFWSMLGEDNTVISDFIGDVVDLFKNAKQDYGQVASSVVNINDKIETYLDNFEKMSINWSNSIEAMNKYADYMAKNLFSLNEKFEFALDKFTTPYQTFQDVITSEDSPLQFEELVAKLDKVFKKNDKMTTTMANKMTFGNFKGDGAAARRAAKDIIASINRTGLAQIDVNNPQQPNKKPAGMIKPWLELPPPPHIDLDIRAPKVRQWVSEEVDPDIEGGWSAPEFNESDLPSNNIQPQRPYDTDRSLLDPVILNPAIRDRQIDEFFNKNASKIAAARISIPTRNPFDRTSGASMYSTYPSGRPGKMTGVGPNGEVFDTYFGPEPPEMAQIGDKWMNQNTLFVWDGERWVLEKQLAMIENAEIDGRIDTIDIARPGLDITDLVTGGGQVALRPDDLIIETDDGNNENGGTPAGTPAGSAQVNQSSGNTGMKVGPMSGALRGPLSYRR